MTRLPVLFLLVVSCAPAAAEPPTAEVPFLLGGIQVHEDDHWWWTNTLKRVGMNTVAVTVYARQGDWDSANLWDEPAPAVIDEIRAAKTMGLDVVLVLRVALDHAFPRNRYLWHGMIMPAGDDALDEWFRRYSSFVVKWAAIADREGVDVLAVGSELNALASTRPSTEIPELHAYYLSRAKQAEYESAVMMFEERIAPRHVASLGGDEFGGTRAFIRGRAAKWEAWAHSVSVPKAADRIDRLNARAQRLERHWRALILETRTIYRGKLTYAANFDQYGRVGFWDSLDLIGVNAYFSLRVFSKPPTMATLEAGWATVLQGIDRFRVASGLSGHPVLFTELGYTYRKHSTVQPWGQHGFSLLDEEAGRDLVIWREQPQDFDERARALRALHRVSRALHPEMLAGILYWKLSTKRAHLPMEAFVLIVEEEPFDPLQTELLRFLD